MLRCSIFGHDFTKTYVQPDPRFIKSWNKWLNESIWLEQFEHTCKRCKEVWIFSRWTREAARKTLQEEDR